MRRMRRRRSTRREKRQSSLCATYHTYSTRTNTVGVGTINGANHDFPLLLPLSIQNTWASIRNTWCHSTRLGRRQPLQNIMGFSGLRSHIHFVWVDGGGLRAPIRNTWASELSYVLYGDFFHSWSSEGTLSTPLIVPTPIQHSMQVTQKEAINTGSGRPRTETSIYRFGNEVRDDRVTFPKL